jgi:NAD(P)-dependent dehydrogenase (short-subunit alcohol dehydrogenase family)
MRLKDKIAVVVGAGTELHPGLRDSGIGNGAATAVTFARQGAKVLLVDKNPDRVADTVSRFKEEGFEAPTFIADVSEESQCEGIIKECLKLFGRIDILQNNVGLAAGATVPDGHVEDLKVEDFDRHYKINLRGLALTTKHALPHMRKQKSGSIVNISSGAAIMAMPILGYSATKLGVHALTQHTAGLGAPDGVRCNCVMLGAIDNRAVRGTPWDVANVSAFLHSEDARFITSLVVPLDGGFTAHLGMLANPPVFPGGGLPRNF